MQTFYDLQPAAQAEAYEQLAEIALRNWGIDDAELALLKMRENAVFSVTCKGGTKYALRIHRAGYHTNAELRSELQWMAALDANGIRTPAVAPALNGEYFVEATSQAVPEVRQVDLLEWVPGSPMGSIEEGVDATRSKLITDYRRIGELAGRLHRFSAAWELPHGFSRHHWDLEGLVGEQPVWGRFWENERLTPDQRELILNARALVRKRLERFGQNERNYGLIHADFLPENLMVDGKEIRLIDFDDAGYGWYLFELATSLFVHLGEDHFDDLLAALLDGYRQHRDLPDDDLRFLPFFFMARLFSYLGWMHTRESTESTEELAPVIIDAAVALAAELVSECGSPESLSACA